MYLEHRGFLNIELEKNINYNNTMEFNGTIVITDPCYFAKDQDWDREDGGFDYTNYGIEEGLGFTNFIWSDTGYGDGSWKVSELNTILGTMELEKFVEDIEEAYYGFFKESNVANQIRLEGLVNQRTTIGRYCVDSGTFGVFYLDEVLNYCPNFLVEYGDWCYTIVRDFVGDIDLYEDSRNQKHILGVGNKTFYSNTVSWL